MWETMYKLFFSKSKRLEPTETLLFTMQWTASKQQLEKSLLNSQPDNS